LLTISLRPRFRPKLRGFKLKFRAKLGKFKPMLYLFKYLASFKLTKGKSRRWRYRPMIRKSQRKSCRLIPLL
jgi:hypothetical protein